MTDHPMRVLVACEYSGRVRQAFRELGHDAWSCDLYEPAEDGSPWHRMGDAARIAKEGWDLMIAHPPCTHLAVSGSRWFAKKRESGEQQEAIDFFMELANAPIERIALENPISIMSTQWRKPDQIIHPWQFGHPEFKATCLWLKGLSPLNPTRIIKPPQKGSPEWVQWNRVHRMSPGADRWKERSRTYHGIAAAMAQQWGSASQKP